MIRGTTPTFILTLNDENVDLTLAENVYVTFSQAWTILTKTGDDLDISKKQISVYLTQEETLSFVFSTLEIQVNWTYSDGQRASSEIKRVSLNRNLINEVLE